MCYTITLLCDTATRSHQIDFNFSRDFKYKTLIDWKKNEYIFTFKNKRDYETAKDITLYNMIYKTYNWVYNEPDNIQIIYKEKQYKDNILINNINMETYKQLYNSVMEELEIEMGDLQFRRNITGMNKYYYPFMLLELKEKMLIRKGLFKTNSNLYKYINQERNELQHSCRSDILNEEPTYTGSCYTYHYASKYHPKIKQPKNKDIYHQPSFNNIKDDNVIKEWFFKTFNNVCWNYIDWTQYTKTKEGNNKWEGWRHHHNGNIKIRGILKKLNYNSTPYPYRSIFSFKEWDKTTKKSSIKGLKALDNGWTYEKTGGGTRTAGWTFGGLKAEDLEEWAIENGFKKETEQTKGKKGMISKKIKYQYGDYADYMLKI